MTRQPKRAMKLFLLLVLACKVGVTSSQILVQPLLPSTGLTVKSQLWNLALTNTTNHGLTVQVRVGLSKALDGQQVLAGVSRTMVLNSGINQLTPTSAAPITYNILYQCCGLTAGQDGFLPVGSYEVCYSVAVLEGDGFRSLSDVCQTATIESLSPPLLRLPLDGDSLKTTQPLFSWTPPASVQLFNNLNYDFKLVEIGPLQTGAEAIKQNVALYSQAGLKSTDFQYPVSAVMLDTVKVYAWQVMAKSNLEPVAESEVWTFNIRKENPLEVRMASTAFSKLKKTLDATYTPCNGVLFFNYLNETTDSLAGLQITDITTALQKQVAIDSVQILIKPGENYKSLNLEEESGIIDKHFYLLEILNARNERWYLKFQYHKPR